MNHGNPKSHQMRPAQDFTRLRFAHRLAQVLRPDHDHR